MASPLDAIERRTSVVSLKLRPSEAAAVELAAQLAGLTVSTMARQLIVSAVRARLLCVEEPALPPRPAA